ncbi:MAG: protein kinase, partial [Bacteroidetes bacterium]|nr:protein kinase [Bacteroidota bacterium]
MPADITQMLLRWSDGDQEALDRLLPLVYDQLKQLAHARLRYEREGHTFDTTALVHEAYLKLVDIKRVQWTDRAHFLAMASQQMRRILIDYARKRKAQKRGGGALKKKIKRGPLPVDEALDVAMQTAQGLVSAHAGGIVHRDVKPANVMVTQSGRVIIVDFGIAKVAALTRLTKTGATVGTVAYMSPEQARGEAVDHRTDLWSLGVVLYEMIAGQRPFSGDYDQAVLYSVLHLDPQSVTGLRPGVPLHLAHLINKALAKSPDQRYQHMNDLLEDLRAIQRRQAARSLAVQDVLPQAPAPGRTPAPAVLALAEDGPARILVVDDEPELELMIQQKFRRQIHANTWLFSFATGGAEALEMLWADPEIALVLTDLNMPGMDGLTLLGHLADLDHPLKAVVVSAYGDIKNIRTAMNRGAFDFLTKPIDLDDLETTIHKTLHELRIYWKAAEAQRQAVAMRQELAVARRIQEANLPLPFPRRSDLDLYAFTTTARDVSGTFYDYFVMGDDRVGFLMGDVAGKGVSAALFTAMSQTFLKRMAQQGEAPGACLTAMNRLLFPEGYADLVVTVFYGLLNTQTGELAYANAGHPTPYALNEGGIIAPLDGAVEAPV